MNSFEAGEAIGRAIFHRSLAYHIERRRCIRCRQKANSFRSFKAAEVYLQNGHCQKCQDKMKDKTNQKTGEIKCAG